MVNRCLNWTGLAIAAALVCSAQPSLTIQPDPITVCATPPHGRATLAWTNDTTALTQVRIGGPAGVPMSGLQAGAGGVLQTADWVDDGMLFVLVNASGNELARATAHVACGGGGPTAAASYMPLAVGNKWTFRLDSRAQTAGHVTWRITRSEQQGVMTWFVLDQGGGDELRLREDSAGRLYQLVSGVESLFFDPNAAPSGFGGTTHAPVSVFGISTDGATYSRTSGLFFESSTFARGFGLYKMTRNLMTGSSGGFTDGLQLEYAKLEGGIRIWKAAQALEVGAESTDLDVTGKTVTNCAIPCYFAACGIAGADPTGTYKPCFEARIAVERAASGPAQSVSLDLLDPFGNAVYSTTLNATIYPAFLLQQVPLYSAPNAPFSPGNYKLRARTSFGTAQDAEAVIGIRIR